MNIANLSVEQLERALSIKKQIASLENELAKILGEANSAPKFTGGPRTMSAAARARIAAAAKARWARYRQEKGIKAPTVKRSAKRTMSPAARAKIAAAMKARWAKRKAQK